MTLADDELFTVLDDRIAALRAIAADPSTYGAPVASCPGWTVSDLLVHLAIIHGWAGEIVAHRSAERPRRPKGVPDGTALADWVTERSTILRDALAAADLDDEVYSFVGPRPISWWLRRQVHETVVHVWDAQAALGAPDVIDPTLAADGADEFLTVFVPGLFDTAAFAGDGHSIHFHATDAEGEWLLRFEGGQLIVSGEHAKGDVAARGPAQQLLLLGWNRVPVDGVETFGDTALLERFLAAAAF